ncbi:MAG: gamma-glutamyltransferase [Coxiellaceae bacterium]|nr:gamma-glutamyltransferase [Coxiellaceae bacterium]
MRIIIFLSCLLFAISAQAKFLPPAQGKNGMVVSADATATRVGVNILKQGGNAVDAAVAIGYALAVTHPCCGNIGGGGFMTLHLANGKNAFIDFREKAPAAITPQLFINKGKVNQKKILHGYLGVGIPGTVMGLNTALHNYGSMSLKQVMKPAITLAKAGHLVSQREAKLYDNDKKSLLADTHAQAIFFTKNKPVAAHTLLKQPDLAHTLREISRRGADYFYKGPIAKAIVAASKKNGGVMTLKDFSHYTVDVTQPVTCNYHDYKVITAPPPGSGTTVCEILNIVNAYPLKKLGFHSAVGSHYTIEAMRFAYYDRNRYLGDPAFIKNPVKKLLSPQYTQVIRNAIAIDHAGNSKNMSAVTAPANEKMQTTHYVVIDKNNNVASTTVTLNGYFGSKVIAGDTGFFLNNELDDFAVTTTQANQFGLIQGKANLIAGNKRPLSSMSPTIILNKNGLPYMAVGAAGGSTIITSIVQTIENSINYQMDINTAVNMPRYHMQWLPDTVFMEPYTFSYDTQHLLKKMGYDVEPGFIFYGSYWGQVAALTAHNGLFFGANDNLRPDGLALGY